MTTIEIDFDVFKKLTSMRETESVSYNNVLRKLLGLPVTNGLVPKEDPIVPPGAWTIKGITFPAGTEFRATYRGQSIVGRVEESTLVVNGKQFHSPSAAAISITGNSVNGWIFWECKLPGENTWQLITSLRKKK